VRPDNTSLDQIKLLHAYCRATATMTLTLALMGLYGWACHITFLTSFIPGHVTTKVNTALCLALASISLLLRISPRSVGMMQRYPAGPSNCGATSLLLTGSRPRGSV
jgi:hypothetical protein